MNAHLFGTPADRRNSASEASRAENATATTCQSRIARDLRSGLLLAALVASLAVTGCGGGGDMPLEPDVEQASQPSGETSSGEAFSPATGDAATSLQTQMRQP